MQDPHKPDLDESLNVTESHDRMLRHAAAVAREKRVDEGGREPVSLWLFGSCAFIMIFAGLALGGIGSLGSLFDYEQTVQPGYVRESLGDDAASGPPPTPALKAYMAKGKKTYSQCLGCHGADGKGSAAFPSLAGSEWAQGDTQRFAMIILHGLAGPTSTGKAYPGGMQAQGGNLGPADLAGVMTYVRNSFGNETGDVVTVEMAEHAFRLSEERSKEGQMSKEELEANYLAPLEGESVAPDTLVDPVTFEPVEEAEG